MKTNFHKAILFAAAVMLANTIKVNAQITTQGNSYPNTSYVGSNTASSFKDIVFKTSTSTVTTERMRILGSTGYVGIGTSTPFEAFQIGDRFTFHNGGFKGMCYNFTYNAGDKRIVADYASGIFLTDIGTIRFRTAPTGAAGSTISWLNAMTIDNAGKILIGDPALVTNFQGTPGNYLLYVQRGILAEKVKVAVATTTDWSDYVFNDNYKLPSINELEAFVKANKHLPNVPSAEEVVKEGVDMAKMDAKLLEKIEELSLYVIELKKENIELVKRMEKLETK